MANNIKNIYLDIVKANGSRPGSIYEFAKLANMAKADVQVHYNTVLALETDLWKGWIEETFLRLNAEPAYAEYVARERMLAFYFTLIEVLAPYKYYVKLAPLGPSLFGGNVLEGFKGAFLTYSQSLINLGKDTGEVEERKFVTDKYNEALWTQCLFLLRFWVKDDSENGEKTDEAIEKSVNLSLDLMARGPIDSLVEFGQFLFKNR